MNIYRCVESEKIIVSVTKGRIFNCIDSSLFSEKNNLYMHKIMNIYRCVESEKIISVKVVSSTALIAVDRKYMHYLNGFDTSKFFKGRSWRWQTVAFKTLELDSNCGHKQLSCL